MNTFFLFFSLAFAGPIPPLTPGIFITALSSIYQVSGRSYNDVVSKDIVLGVTGSINSYHVLKANVLGPSLIPLLEPIPVLQHPYVQVYDQSGFVTENSGQPVESIISGTYEPGTYTFVSTRRPNPLDSVINGASLLQVEDSSNVSGLGLFITEASLRGYVSSTAQFNSPLIMGVITKSYRGTGHEFIFRARGLADGNQNYPGLSPFLANPKIRLFRAGVEIAANNDYTSLDSHSRNILSQLHADTDLRPQDAALVLCLTPGKYTLVVESEGSASGSVIANVIDAYTDHGVLCELNAQHKQTARSKTEKDVHRWMSLDEAQPYLQEAQKYLDESN